MQLALRYCKEERTLAVSGHILLTNGNTHALSSDNVIRYTIDEACTAGESITLGDTRAADFALEIEDAAHALTAGLLIGAQVTLNLSLDGAAADPFGVWYVDSATVSRQSATVSLSGSDALASKADSLYIDGAYPATLGDIALRVASQAGLTLKSASFRNSAVSVTTQPEWNTQTNTQRAVIGYVAACAGGFARIDRAGMLEIVAYNTAASETVTADYFSRLTVGGGASFAYNCLQVSPYGTNVYVRYAIDASRTDTAGDTLRISDNPLMTPEIAKTLVTALTGFTCNALIVDWCGDPTMQPGTPMTVQDTDGSAQTGIVTRQIISLDGGLHAQTSADLPSDIKSTFVDDTLFTPSGRINIAAIEGRLKVWAEEEIDVAVGASEQRLQTQINAVPGQITVAVGASEQRLQTQINAVPGQITAAVGNVQIGGTNLIRETGWHEECAPGSAGWDSVGDGIARWPYEQYPNADDFYTEGFILFTDANGGSDIWSPYLKVKEGETYTLSFRHRGSRMQAIWAGMDVNGTLIWAPSKTYDTYLTSDYSETRTIPTGVAQLRIVFRSTAGLASVFGRVKLEKGNKATAWSPNPLDKVRTAGSVIKGSALSITEEGVNIETPVFSVNVSGTNGDMSISENGMSINQINSPSVRQRYTGPTTLYVLDGADGVNVFATLGDVFAKLSGKFLPSRVSIHIGKSTVETASLTYTSGASITVYGNNNTLSGSIELIDIPAPVSIHNLSVVTGTDEDCVTAARCSYLNIANCTLRATSYNNGRTRACIRSNTSFLNIESSAFWSGYWAILADYNTLANVNACKGNWNTYAIYAQRNSTVGVATSRPSADNGCFSGGTSEIRGAYSSYDDGSGTTLPSQPSATTTAALTATNSRTHDGGGWYSGTNVLSQGKTTTGTFRGFMWFDLSAISGKTIKAASIRLYRRAGVGKGSPVVVLIATHNASGPSGSLATVAEYSDIIGTVDQKETLSASIPVAAVQQLADGTAKGLYIYGSAANYSQFDGYDGSTPPVLTVTYT